MEFRLRGLIFAGYLLYLAVCSAGNDVLLIGCLCITVPTQSRVAVSCDLFILYVPFTAAFNVSLELQGGNCSDQLNLTCRYSDNGVAPLWIRNGTLESGDVLRNAFPGAVYTVQTRTEHTATISGVDNLWALDGFIIQCAYDVLGNLTKSNAVQYFFIPPTIPTTPTKSNEMAPSDDTGAIAGGTVGGVILIAVISIGGIVIIVICICFCKRNEDGTWGCTIKVWIWLKRKDASAGDSAPGDNLADVGRPLPMPPEDNQPEEAESGTLQPLQQYAELEFGDREMRPIAAPPNENFDVK